MIIKKCDRCGKNIIPDTMFKGKTGEFHIILVYDVEDKTQDILLCETCMKEFVRINGPLHAFMENENITLIRKFNLSCPIGPQLTPEEKTKLEELMSKQQEILNEKENSNSN
ncbi:MAG: hypothetical protein ACTSWR_06005 [Candidatus Helarchaeota archaeon]